MYGINKYLVASLKVHVIEKKKLVFVNYRYTLGSHMEAILKCHTSQKYLKVVKVQSMLMYRAFGLQNGHLS
jgi:hypothetical protein